MIPLAIPLPSGWEVASLEQIAVNKGLVSGPFGSAISKKYFVGEGVPVIRGSNLSTDGWFHDDGFVFITDERADELANAEVLPGDLVFTAAGTLGQVGLLPSTVRFPRYIASNKQLRARIAPDVADARYVFYWFRVPAVADFVASMNRGSSVPLLTLGVLRDLPVPVPPLEDQRRIADFVEGMDLRIENNRRRIAILEEMARLIYREWFVHFRFPGHEDVELVASDLGSIPERWEVERLADAAELVMGQSPKSEFYNAEGEGLPFHQGVTSFGARYPVHEKWCTLEGRLAEKGDVLLSVRAPVGRINVAPDRLVIGRGLAALRSKRETQVFLFETLREVFKDEDSMGGGTIFKAVTKRDLTDLKVIHPPADLVARFEAEAGPLFRLVESLTFQNRVLAEARDLLLPRLVSGELDVSDLDLDLEPVG